MYTHLGSVTLRTGEQLDLGCVRCPDPSWGAQVIPLLGHKSRETRDHFEAAFAGPLDELDTRFYVGTIGGLAVTNVMIVGAHRSSRATGRSGVGDAQPAPAAPSAPAASPGGAAETTAVGILGHVYTRPEHRQKGAYGSLMPVAMEHLRRDGYRALTLGTGFETHPYWIYHGHGFRSIDGVSGKMKWLAEAGFEQRWFRPGSAHVREMRWDDWAPLNLLAFQPAAADESLPRSLLFALKGQGTLEGPFQTVQRRRRRGEPLAAVVLESGHGATVGWAVLQPDPLAFGDGRQLDLYVHPHFTRHAPDLLAALPWPADTRVAAYTTSDADYRADALRGAGFTQVAALPSWLKRGDDRLPLRVFARG
jgi:GNAT superfamily N-acetyltransferase